MFITWWVFIRRDACNLVLLLVSRPPSLFALASDVRFLFLKDLLGYNVLVYDTLRGVDNLPYR